MRLIIARHGETEENVKNIHQGQTHGILTKKGINQHKKLAKRLKNEKIDVIYSSDLRRTEQLAKEIHKFHKKVPFHYAKELRERTYGIFDGKSYSEGEKYAEEKGCHFYTLRHPGGESLNDLKKRTIKFYKKIINKYKNTDKTILFATHGGYIVSLLFYVLKLDETRENFKKINPLNTAVTILEIDKKGNHKAKLVNCIKHL